MYNLFMVFMALYRLVLDNGKNREIRDTLLDIEKRLEKSGLVVVNDTNKVN